MKILPQEEGLQVLVVPFESKRRKEEAAIGRDMAGIGVKYHMVGRKGGDCTGSTRKCRILVLVLGRSHHAKSQWKQKGGVSVWHYVRNSKKSVTVMSFHDQRRKGTVRIPFKRAFRTDICPNDNPGPFK
jgi:hypothetical protein